jgi:uncharacterized protein with HEPN domain
MRNPIQEDPVYLGDILHCIHNIAAYTHAGEAEFFQSSLIQDAVARKFEIIGEATKRLSPELRQAHSNIPWRRMAGFRDILIHSYMNINLANVWQAVQEIVSLEAEIASIHQKLISTPNQDP